MEATLSPDDTVTAPVRRVACAALAALNIAADLLTEAARTLGSDSTARALQDEVASLSRRIPQIEDSERGAADAVFVACEIVHLCDQLAGRHRLSSPAAVGCAKLAEAGAQLALEALTEDRGRSGVQALSRRARQVVQIQEAESRLDDMVATLERHGVQGTHGA